MGGGPDQDSGYGPIAGDWSTARSAWDTTPADHRHEGDRNPPFGALAFYGGSGDRHVTLTVEDGRQRSTDYPTSGRLGEGGIAQIESYVGRPYLGWTDWVGGYLIQLTPPEPEDDLPYTEQQLRDIIRTEIATLLPQNVLQNRYQFSLGRDGDEDKEIEAWLQQSLLGTPIESISNQIGDSPEARKYATTTAFNTFIGRAPTAKDYAYYATKPVANIIESIKNSPEAKK